MRQSLLEGHSVVFIEPADFALVTEGRTTEELLQELAAEITLLQKRIWELEQKQQDMWADMQGNDI